MPIKDLPIFGQYNVQQFLQFVPEDLANWTLIKNPQAKKGYAFYPAMGRRHVQVLNKNTLIFDAEPRAIYKSNNYMYVFVGQNVYRYDKGFNRILLNIEDFTTQTSAIYFTYLVVPGYTLAIFTDGVSMWVHNEKTDNTVRVIDSNLIANPTALIAFGNRIAVTGKNTSEFRLSQINLGPLSGDNINPANCFTVSGNAVFAYESENIVNFAVLHNTLYIFLESQTSVWSNIPSVFSSTSGTVVTFPWKNNTTYNFDYGLASPFALSADFGRLVWLGKNQDGLTQVVASSGEQPKPISTKAIDILLSRNELSDEISPFLSTNTEGFLYQYQNTVYFRLSAGTFFDYGVLDISAGASSVEYNFDTGTWQRLIEANGERNRIQQHVFFSNRHLVTVLDESTIYEMSGQFFTNDVRNTSQENPQASNAYTQVPFRYERVTPIISEDDYSEFITDWVQIDFVWGYQTYMRTDRPFTNAVFVSDEAGALLVTEEGNYIVTEDSDYPVINESAYNNWFNPTVELFFSDDGGLSYFPADVREFSPLGKHSWRMRWYQLGPSRNRVYKLVCVSAAPIVVLGAIMNTRRASAGAA